MRFALVFLVALLGSTPIFGQVGPVRAPIAEKDLPECRPMKGTPVDLVTGAKNAPKSLQRPTIVKRVAPASMSGLLPAGVRVTTAVRVVLSESGCVEDVSLIKSGFPASDTAVFEAVRQWRYLPALVEGEPVPVVIAATVNFGTEN